MIKKAATIQYFATAYGYKVTAYAADGQPVDEYAAGNSRACSQTYIAPDAPGAVPEKQLRIWAEEQARELADKLGLPVTAISYDADGEADYAEEMEEGVL